jgi:hypothetical protein
VRWGLGGGSGSAVEDVDRGLGHGLVGVGEEETDLPHFGVAELGFEGGHSGEADAVEHFPVGFADGIVANADNVRFAVMGLEKLRGVGVHVCADRRRTIVKAVADGAAVDVDVGPGDEVCGVGLHVGADHFTLHSRVEWDVDELALMRKGRVIGGHRDLAIHEVHEYGEGNQNESDDESNDEAHACLLPPPLEFHRRAWKRR